MPPRVRRLFLLKRTSVFNGNGANGKSFNYQIFHEEIMKAAFHSTCKWILDRISAKKIFWLLTKTIEELLLFLVSHWRQSKLKHLSTSSTKLSLIWKTNNNIRADPSIIDDYWFLTKYIFKWTTCWRFKMWMLHNETNVSEHFWDWELKETTVAHPSPPRKSIFLVIICPKAQEILQTDSSYSSYQKPFPFALQDSESLLKGKSHQRERVLSTTAQIVVGRLNSTYILNDVKTGKEHYTNWNSTPPFVRRLLVLLRFHYYVAVVSPCLLYPAHNQELMKLSKIYLRILPHTKYYISTISTGAKLLFQDSSTETTHHNVLKLKAAHSKDNFRNNTLEIETWIKIITNREKPRSLERKMPSFFVIFSWKFFRNSVSNGPRRLPTSHKFANKFHQTTNSTEQPKIVKSNEKNWFFPFWCSATRRGERCWICSRLRTMVSILLNSIFRFYFH